MRARRNDARRSPQSGRRGPRSTRAGCRRAHRSPAPVLDQRDGLRAHAQMERREGLAALSEKVEEMPLRHQGEELGARGQMTEVRKRKIATAEALDDASR